MKQNPVLPLSFRNTGRVVELTSFLWSIHICIAIFPIPDTLSIPLGNLQAPFTAVKHTVLKFLEGELVNGKLTQIHIQSILHITFLPFKSSQMHSEAIY